MLAIALAIGGIGASTQHPIASALVARAFKGPRSLKALGGYNFAGDIGKMTIPALAALMITVMPWRPAVGILGAAGFVAAIAIMMLTPRYVGGSGRRRRMRRNNPHAGRDQPVRLSDAAVDRRHR